ncbi:MAG: hypothetical protein GXP62_00590 [Oligoflexia bacterium]|nr:hypothetical protein [Oligoflexia bacterium]
MLLLLSLLVQTPTAKAASDQSVPGAPLFDDRDEPTQSSLRSPDRMGIGLGIGTSTAGLSGKYFLKETMSVQAVLGAGYGATTNSAGWTTGFGLGADILAELPSFAAVDDVEFGISAGPGLGLWTAGGQFNLAAAGVVGLEACLLTFPIDFVIEYRPRVMLAPTLGIDWFNLSGHIRYYFPARHR